MNLPPNHHAAQAFGAPSGAPSVPAIEQAVKQEQSKAAVNAGTTSAQNATMIADKVREVMADLNTRSAQENADVRAVMTAKAIQANSGLPVTNLGTDPVEIARRIYG